MKFFLYFGFIFSVLSGAIYFPTIGKLLESFPQHPHKNILAILILTLPALFAFLSSIIVGIRAETHEKKKILFYALAAFGTLGFLALNASNLIEILVIRIFIGLSAGAITTGFVSILLEQEKKFGKLRLFPNIVILLFGFTFALFVLNSWLAESHWKIAHYLHLIAFAYLPFFTLYIFEPETATHIEEKLSSKTESETQILSHHNIQRNINKNIIITCFIGLTLFIMPRYLHIYLEDSHPLFEDISGKLVLLVTGAAILGAWWTRRVSLRWEPLSLEILSLCSLGISYSILAFLPAETPLIILSLVLLGLGLGTFFANIFTWTLELSVSQHYSKNISKLIAFLYLSQCISPFIVWFSLEHFGISSILQVTVLFMGLLLVIDILRHFNIRNQNIL